MEHWIGFWTALWIGSARISKRLVDWLFGVPRPAKPGPKSTAGKAAKPEVPKSKEESGAQPEPKEQAPAKAKKPKSEEAAGGSVALRFVSLALAAGFIKGLPYTTLIAEALAVVWLLLALVLGYAAAPATPSKAPKPDASEPSAEAVLEAPPHPSEALSAEYVTALLHAVYTTGSGVHLTTLAERLGVLFPEAEWRTRDVRSLLARVGVPTKPVRAGATGAVSEGVHRDHFPPLPEETPEGVVAAGQTANNNTNNSPEREAREGFSILKDPGHPSRHDVQHHNRRTA
ncbi:hypothetical protein ACIBJC_15200 [Streptomyces sp. NPDC050509]|uniref:hypothetical protein n=1 Tax=Streptomyces sp. NPDC050509 TaxID=3365620 RepID=UPI00379E3419